MLTNKSPILREIIFFNVILRETNKRSHTSSRETKKRIHNTSTAHILPNQKPFSREELDSLKL